MGVILGDPWAHTQPSLVCGGGVVVAAWANKQLATVASVWSWSSARPSVPRIVTGRLLTPRGKNLPYPEDACGFITVKTAERNPELCLHKPQHVKITHFRNIMKRIYGLLKMFVKTPFSSHTLKLLSSPMMCISKTPLPASDWASFLHEETSPQPGLTMTKLFSACRGKHAERGKPESSWVD